ncbi:MAG: calcium-binding protein, partial [Pseudomonadota bacterium]|nr:calcium-binding protein [Pseudomonadota bacterium]
MVTMTGTAGDDRLVGSGEADLLRGLGGHDILKGAAGDDRLEGDEGDDGLYGGLGDDLLIGGIGNDTYYVDSIGDAVSETAGNGIDLVFSAVSFSLYGQDVERLTLAGTAAINATGNSLANILTGNAAANILDGAAGADLMRGGDGNDTYHVDDLSDVVVEASGAGNDLVISSVSFSLQRQNIERLTLTGTQAIDATGNALANTLIGNGAANVLNGAAGADRMEGRGGNDTYHVDNAGDEIIELGGQGLDRVLSSVSFTLGAHVENLVLTGSTALEGTGNSLRNTITGNAAANVLDGQAGADIMRGGGGDDIYRVDHASDRAIESAGSGTDEVLSSTSFTLGSYVEKLTLTGSAAANGTGNALANTIVGNAAANVLDGGGGADLLTGGSGADSFAFTTKPSSGNVDRVTDFAAATDKILLGGLTGQPFEALASGPLGAGAFRVGPAAADADDRIIYTKSTGALSYDADGSGAGAAIQFATLPSGLT